MGPIFFASTAAFRRWLQKNHTRADELWVGFYKRATHRPSMTWPESVAEALCFGWIDGLRRRIDDERYMIRFTPRRPGSTWSAINIRLAKSLIAENRMRPAGRAAFQARLAKKSVVYSYENRPQSLPPEFEKLLRKDRKEWAYFQAQAPWYRRTVAHWITSAKREETRMRRLASLIEACRQARAIGPLSHSTASNSPVRRPQYSPPTR